MAKGLLWATTEDIMRNRSRVLSLYRQILRSLNSPDLPLTFATRLAKKAEVRAIFMLGSEEQSIHNIADLMDTAEYSLSLLKKGEIPKQTQEEDAYEGVKKKSKKRKNEESSASREEDGDVHVSDEGHKKRMRIGDLVDTNASEVLSDVNSILDVGSSPKKEKKKDRSRKGEKDQGNDNKREKKKKKSKMGDEGGACSVLEASDENIHGKSEDRGFGEPKQRKKEKVYVDEMNRSDRKNMKDKDNSTVIKADGGVTTNIELVKEREEQALEEGQVKKNKKKIKMKDLRKKNADCAVENDNCCAGFNENQIENDVIEKVEPTVDEKKKKKKKKKRDDDGVSGAGPLDPSNSHMHSISSDDNRGGKGSKMKKRKSDRSNTGDTIDGTSETNERNGTVNNADFVENEIGNETIEKADSMEKEKRKKKKDDLRAGGKSKRKEKSVGSNSEPDPSAVASEKKKKKKKIEVTEPSEKSTPNKKLKKVSFSDRDEVFPLPNGSSIEDEGKENEDPEVGLVHGKRFSEEEDELVKKAVLDYIEDHQLGDNGIEMVMKCRAYPEIKGCWKEIGKALPHRPHMAVYSRAHILFERSESRKWTPEELELVKKFHEKHGADWRTLADELGKHRFHVKDAWRRIRYPNMKKGDWSQEEYQNLFELVNLDLSMKALQEKKSKHGMLRDNISWEAIADKLSTRSNAVCCQKWYYQLTSPMVAEGEWADADDYRLLIALVDLDAACEEDVDWDNLLEHRSGDVCLKRWNQMVRHIGQYGTKPFTEQVEILSQRYCAELLEAREAYDSKEPVD